MRVSTLPTAGLMAGGTRLRIEAAKAISAVEINGGLSVNAGKSTLAKPLTDFFTACIAAIATFVDVTAPTLVAKVINPAKAKRLTIQFSEGLDRKFVPAPAAFTVAGQVQVPSCVIIEGPFVHLDFPIAFTASPAVTVAYTQPGSTTNLRDISGNLVATFTASAVTNNIT